VTSDTGTYESVPLPQLPDGRTFISDEMIASDPSLSGLLERGHNFWTYDRRLFAWVSPMPEEV